MRSAGKTRMIHGARHPTLAQEMATIVKAKFVAQKSVHVGWTPSLGPKVLDAQLCHPNACSSITCKLLAATRTQEILP